MRTNVSLIKADTEEGFGVGVTRGHHIHQSPQGLASPLFFFSPHFSGGSAGKEFTCNPRLGNLGLIPWVGRFPGEGNGYPRQYSGLENSMNCIVPEVAKTWTQLSDFHFPCSPPSSSCLARNPVHFYNERTSLW